MREYEDQASLVADCSCDASDEMFHKSIRFITHAVYIEGKSPQETFRKVRPFKKHRKVTGQTFAGLQS